LKKKEQEIREKREALKIKAAEILDKAIAENRGLDEKEDAEVRSYGDQIASLNQALAMLPEEDREQRENVPNFGEGETGEQEAEEIRAFSELLRSAELRSTDATIPIEIASNVFTRAVDGSFMRALGVSFDRVSVDRDIPVTSTPFGFDIVEEGTEDAYGDLSDPLGVKNFRALITGGFLTLPESYISDSAVNLPAYFTTEASNALAEYENRAYFVGATKGTKSIAGLAGEGTAWAKIAGTDAITFAEGRQFRLALASKWRSKGAVIAMHSSTLAAIIDLNDGNNNYLVSYNEAKGYYHIDGVRIIENDNIDEIGAGKKVMYFYSPAACKGMDRIGMEVRKFEDSVLAKKGQVGFRMKARTDFHLMEAAGCQIMEMAAA